jgi:hypothetical protein
MKTFRNPLLALFLCLGIPLTAHCSSTQGAWVNNLRSLAEAIWYYHDTFKTLPSDIVDGQGKPLLSWRVRILPFIEQNHLYKQFKLDQPWDSPHDRELIGSIPHTYLNPYYADADAQKAGKAYVVAPRGPKTFFGIDKARSVVDIQNPMAIMLVEVDPKHAPIWTKPQDLLYDPAIPENGLGRWRYMVMANKDVRAIGRAGIDSDFLRALFSIEKCEPIPLELPWYKTWSLPSVGGMIQGCFLISLVFVAVSLAVVYRMVRKKPTSPGEMLCLVIGVQQLVVILAFMACYRYQVLPGYFGRNKQQIPLWAIPGVAGACAAIVPVLWFRSVRVWRIFFALVLAWLSILAFESSGHHQDFRDEEALTTIGHPIFFALAAAVMAGITLFTSARKHISGRALCHWAGIATAIVPLVWFSVCCSQGLVAPRDLFVRILE